MSAFAWILLPVYAGAVWLMLQDFFGKNGLLVSRQAGRLLRSGRFTISSMFAATFVVAVVTRLLLFVLDYHRLQWKGGQFIFRNDRWIVCHGGEETLVIATLLTVTTFVTVSLCWIVAADFYDETTAAASLYVRGGPRSRI